MSYPLAPLRPSPMLARPDTPAVLAVEDRGMPAILAACDVSAWEVMDGLYPPVRDASGTLPDLFPDRCLTN